MLPLGYLSPLTSHRWNSPPFGQSVEVAVEVAVEEAVEVAVALHCQPHGRKPDRVTNNLMMQLVMGVMMAVEEFHRCKAEPVAGVTMPQIEAFVAVHSKLHPWGSDFPLQPKPLVLVHAAKVAHQRFCSGLGCLYAGCLYTALLQQFSE